MSTWRTSRSRSVCSTGPVRYLLDTNVVSELRRPRAVDAVRGWIRAQDVPDSGPERDTPIAATAIIHGLTVATRNVTDFATTGVPLLDRGRCDSKKDESLIRR